MKLNIGETIKKLRKERDITQEEFSEVLGVSCQSVSRWENGTCYPDIELIPVIAAFFGISTDKLMGIDEIAERTAVDKYLNAFQKAISRGEVDNCIRIAREGVAEFPNNYALLNKLMYALFVAGSDDADIPDWKDNMQKYDGEIVALGERIAKYCPDTDIRFEATARLAFQHCEMGRKAIGRSIYETLPTMIWCKESVIWWGLNEEEKLPHLREYIEKAYTLLNAGISKLKYILPAEDAIKVLEKMYALEKLMYDGASGVDSWRTAKDRFHHARFCMQLQQPEEALEQLKLSAAAAIAFDNRPTEQKTSSLLLGEELHRRIDCDTADSRPLCEILRDSWLAASEFDDIRDTDEFQKIVHLLS
ncbi:MAG: helix-turn-helix transcriptional regulator [Clostridia bacterium]|nr:helix-turn-helix transcriptional regulator [Clostridia bacterium]